MEPREGEEVWDLLICEACGHRWSSPDLDEELRTEPEVERAQRCPRCNSDLVVREERG